MTQFTNLFHSKKVIIGMIHLPALPGTFAGKGAKYADLVKFALHELDSLQKGGVNGVIVENFWDLPYCSGEVAPVTIASMAAVAGAVVSKASVPVGINILYNSYHAEISVARAVGASFLREEVFVDPAISETGWIPAGSADLIRERTALYAEDVAILADVQGKNTTPMWNRPITESAVDAEKRGLADAVVITGMGTGKPASIDDLQQVREVIGIPLLAGSGVNPRSLASILSVCDGAIVGSYFKQGGNIQAPTDPDRVAELMSVAKKAA